MGRLGRTFKLARAGTAASGMKFTSSYARVVRLGRMQKAAAARGFCQSDFGVGLFAANRCCRSRTGQAESSKTHNLSAARLERSVVSANVSVAQPSVVLKRGSLITPEIEQNILKSAGKIYCVR